MFCSYSFCSTFHILSIKLVNAYHAYQFIFHKYIHILAKLKVVHKFKHNFCFFFFFLNFSFVEKTFKIATL